MEEISRDDKWDIDRVRKFQTDRALVYFEEGHGPAIGGLVNYSIELGRANRISYRPGDKR